MPQAWTIDTPFFLLAIYTPDMKPLKTTHLFFVNTEFFCLVKTVTFDGLFFPRGLGREIKPDPGLHIQHKDDYTVDILPSTTVRKSTKKPVNVVGYAPFLADFC